jgi:hypothetical protein
LIEIDLIFWLKNTGAILYYVRAINYQKLPLLDGSNGLLSLLNNAPIETGNQNHSTIHIVGDLWLSVGWVLNNSMTVKHTK